VVSEKLYSRYSEKTVENAVAKNFKDLSEHEILALAISSEETDARIYADFAEGLKVDYPATSQIFKEMKTEEDEHRRELIEEYRRRSSEPSRWGD
jgi:rubrerythrin